MEQDSISKLKDVTEKIHSIYVSEQYNKLKAYHSKPTFLDTIGKPRNETVFSSLLAWVLSNPEFYKAPSSPLMYLLMLLAKNAIAQHRDNVNLMDTDLYRSILTNSLSIDRAEVNTEFMANGKERIDIMINLLTACKKQIRIFIENKIDSPEGKDQCKKYYDYFSNGSGKQDNSFDIFVFLSIGSNKEISSPHFIKITHQEILDYILKPTALHSDCYTETSANYLNEYINALISIKTQGKLQIAMDYNIQKLLKEFYENNQDIIDQAVLAGCDNEKVIEAITEKRTKIRRNYKIECNGDIKTVLQKNLLEEVAFLCDFHKIASSMEDFESKFPCLGKSCYTTDEYKTGYNSPRKLFNKSYRISNQLLRADRDSVLMAFIKQAKQFGISINSL